jgi:DNA helicase-2/ATP-dependent DNA helicase PcrA
MESDREIEEERRLCYVGITRAKEELFLTYAGRRTLFGSIAYNPPSRFLREIPKELFHTAGGTKVVSGFDPDEDEYRPSQRIPAGTRLWDSGPKSPREVQRAAESAGFRVGQRVRHDKFGVGVVLNVTGEGDNTTVEVVFPNVGPKKLVLAYAKLEKVK